MKLLLPNLQLETPVGKLLVRITEKERLTHEKLISSYFFFKFFTPHERWLFRCPAPSSPQHRFAQVKVWERLRGAAWVAGYRASQGRGTARTQLLPRFIFLDHIPEFSPFHVPQFLALEPASRWVSRPGARPGHQMARDLALHTNASARPKTTGPRQRPWDAPSTHQGTDTSPWTVITAASFTRI